MAILTGVHWTNSTHNFWIGCKKVSAGCKWCYAEREMEKYGWDFKAVRRVKGFDKPLHWKEPKMIFTCSWSDFFLPEADEWREEAWDVIRATPWHTWQILTKRPERIYDHLPHDWGNHGYENVWLGVTAENQEQAELRIPELVSIKAKVRFLSCEPLLGPLTVKQWLGPEVWSDWSEPDDNGMRKSSLVSGGISWVITGGESGDPDEKIRIADTDWFRQVRDESVTANVPFFFKQVGGKKKIAGIWGGNELDGRTWEQWPVAPKALPVAAPKLLEQTQISMF